MYPSVASEFNTAPNTIIAHLTIPEKVYEFENRFGRDSVKYRREGQFMEDLQSHVWMEFFHRWFGFASYGEMYDDVIEYFSDYKYPMGELCIHDSQGRMPLSQKIPYNDSRPSLSVKIMSDRDAELLMNRGKIDIPTFDFGEYNSFTQIYDKINSSGGIGNVARCC